MSDEVKPLHPQSKSTFVEDACGVKGHSVSARSEAARLMGRSQSAAKSEAARLNGRRGGRPPGQSADEATRKRMREAQRKRRQSEKASRIQKEEPA